MSFCLILLAGGSSNRFKSNLAKPYHKIAGKTLIEHIIKKTTSFKQIKKIVIVYHKKDFLKIKKLGLKNITLVQGGETRQISTFNALKYLKNQNGISKVLIHDAARPNVSSHLIASIIKKMNSSKAVVPTLKIQDAVKQKFVSGKYEYIISKDREDLFLTQTPQAFNLNEIYNFHKDNRNKYQDDDISLFMNLEKVKFIQGETNNFKITVQSDFQNLKNIYKSKQSVGIGFDVHRLVPKKKLYLGGFKN